MEDPTWGEIKKTNWTLMKARKEDGFKIIPKKIKDIPVIGDMMRGKADDCFRLYYENIDGLLGKSNYPLKYKSWKIKKLDSIRTRMEIDIMSMTEVRVNWGIIYSMKFKEVAISNKESSRTMVSYNKHETFNLKQQGDTGIMAW